MSITAKSFNHAGLDGLLMMSGSEPREAALIGALAG